MNEVPSIDFDRHPAYAPLRERVPPPDPALDDLIDDIDRRYATLRCGASLSLEARRATYSSEIGPQFDELARMLPKQPGVRPALATYAGKAIDLARSYLYDALEADERTLDAAATGPAVRPLAELRRDGYCRLGVYPNLAGAVWRQTWWERSVLRAQARSAPRRRCALALHSESPAAALIRHHLRESGALEAVSRYIGKPMAFLYAALDHAHTGQDWYADCYRDAGLTTSRTAYMHFDADHDVMKAMLYLKDVGPGNGPFGYVRGSHAWQRSPVLCALQKGFDQVQAGLFELEDDGLDFKDGYYRPRFKVPEYRTDQLALPAGLRGSTHFGDDVEDGSELSRSLLSGEEVFTGPAGTFVLFDGSRGIHRGSLATEGERWAVQIGMRVGSGSEDRGVLQALNGRFGYYKHRAKVLIAGWRS